MTATARFNLPLLTPGQSQKEAFHNEALAGLDALVHPCVESIGETAPPDEPESGAAWIVGADADGAWAGKGDSLAGWTAGGWRFFRPAPGMMVWNKVTERLAHWSGSAWIEDGWPAAALVIDGQKVVGQRQPDVPSPSGGTTIDIEARAAIDALIETLKSHGLID